MEPTKIFFTNGVGRHKEKVGSFEKALRDANIAKYNLSEVSSVIPPKAEIIEVKEGIKSLSEGEIIFTVIARKSTSQKNNIISSCLGVARPVKEKRGFIIEKSKEGKIRGEAKKIAEELIEGEIDESFEITATAEGEKDVWTTTVSAAIFIE